MIQANDNCLVLFMQYMPCAFVLALANAGNNMPARIAMIAITTNSSIKVKPLGLRVASFRFLMTTPPTCSVDNIDFLEAASPSQGWSHLQERESNSRATLRLIPALPFRSRK